MLAVGILVQIGCDQASKSTITEQQTATVDGDQGRDWDSKSGIAEHWNLQHKVLDNDKDMKGFLSLFPEDKNKELLLVPIGDQSLRVVIVRDKTDKSKDEVWISNLKTGAPLMQFKCHGQLGRPQFEYSGDADIGKGVSWRDLDGDGRFDVYVAFEEKKSYIIVGEKRIKARIPDANPVNGAIGEDGTTYRFEICKGWLPTTKTTTQPATSDPVPTSRPSSVSTSHQEMSETRLDNNK